MSRTAREMRAAQIVSEALDGATAASDGPLRLVVACARALPVTGVGLALMTDAGPAGSVAVSDPQAAVLERLQFTLGEGPCVECSATGRPVLQPDLALTGPARWPAFAAGALEAGIRAVFALPLRVGGIRLGALTLYRDQPGELSDGHFTEALCYADAATELLLHVQEHQHQRSTCTSGPGTIPVIEDRAEVHQATGMVAVQAGLSMADALVLLRARAFTADRLLSDVADDVLAGVVKFAHKAHDDGVDGSTAY